MCGDLLHHHDLPAGAPGEDEFLLDTPVVRGFIGDVRAAIAASDGPAAAIEAISPAFTRLLHDQDWLPEDYQAPVPNSGMGGGIGQWLIFRSGARDLCLFALVVPSGSATVSSARATVVPTATTRRAARHRRSTSASTRYRSLWIWC